MKDKILLNIKEVADLLGVSRPTVYSLMHREIDPLPYIKLGYLTKFNVAALTAWIERQGVTE